MGNKLKLKVEGTLLTLEREFDAPKELVFEVHSSAEHLKQWWGPRGWELTHCSIDFRPGGVWHYCMTCKDKNQGEYFGMESWGKGIYKTIDAPNEIQYTDYFSDAEGNIAEGMPPSQNVWEFKALEGNRTLLVNKARYESEEAIRQVLEMGMEQGIDETLDRLDEYLQSLR
ncbi:SRPBCC domain-containing protein [Paenibacillus sp. CAU 1782]